MPASRTIAALAGAAMVVTACRDDGRTLEPAPDVPVSLETTTTTGPEAGPPPVEPELGGISLTSPAFVEGGALDEAYTCDGTNVPPPLAITGVPEGVAELAIVVTDRTAGGFVHWAVAGIPPSATTIESGLLPPEAVSALTDTAVEGWDGPCPPPGDGAHTYDFAVYASAEPIGLSPGTHGRTAVELIQQAAVASDIVSATYASPAPG